MILGPNPHALPFEEDFIEEAVEDIADNYGWTEEEAKVAKDMYQRGWDEHQRHFPELPEHQRDRRQRHIRAMVSHYEVLGEFLAELMDIEGMSRYRHEHLIGDNWKRYSPG